MECGSKGQAEDGVEEQRGSAEVSAANTESVPAPRVLPRHPLSCQALLSHLIVCIITHVCTYNFFINKTGLLYTTYF